MINKKSSDYTPYEKMLNEAFSHHSSAPNIFNGDLYVERLRDIFILLVNEGRSISELETARFGVIDENSQLGRMLGQGKGRLIYKAFVYGLKSMLTHKDHHHKATEYILANAPKYKEMSIGFFDEDRRTLDTLPPVSSFKTVPNYCRNEDGSVRGNTTFTRMLMSGADCDILLLSALSHLDAEAVDALMANERFSAHMSAGKSLGIIKRQMQICPAMGLEETFGYLFREKNHVVFLAEMNQLLESKNSTKKDFERAFWADASRIVIDRLVSQAVKFDYNANSQREFMLQVFRENNVDFYPGLVLAERGEGRYFDELAEPPDLLIRHTLIMDVIGKRAKLQKTVSEQDLSALLLDIPLDTLMAHRDSDLLLKHIYKGTHDKQILKLIQDKQFKGQMLGDQLGL